MNASALARRIKDRALEIGFDKAGVSEARRSARAEAFEGWLARGFHGGMDYLARDPGRRADPRVRDPWARSVVSVAWNYATGRRETAGLLAGIARYAAGEDYHEVLASRLEQLASFVRAEAPGTRTRVAVDTSAMLERDAAAAAGLGWNAKNTMLIDETLGSWTLLGEIVTEVELQPDQPAADRCGSCRACLDACPTGAILEEGLLDARRCISTWTIELRGQIPSADRAGVGDHLFGCDICQDVCPWNRSAPASADPAARPLAGLAETTLAGAAALTEDGFRALFARSSIRRTKRRGLVRNALVVGANTGNADVLEKAPALLADVDPVVRGAAAWAIGRAGTARARARLEGALHAETDAEVAAEIRAALESRDQPSSGVFNSAGASGSAEATGSPTSNSSPLDLSAARRTG